MGWVAMEEWDFHTDYMCIPTQSSDTGHVRAFSTKPKGWAQLQNTCHIEASPSLDSQTMGTFRDMPNVQYFMEYYQAHLGQFGSDESDRRVSEQLALHSGQL